MNRFEKDVQTTFSQFPRPTLSPSQQDRLWHKIEAQLDPQDQLKKKKNVYRSRPLVAGIAAFLLLALLIVPFFVQSLNPLQTAASIQELIQKSSLKDKQILTLEPLPDQGALIFYQPLSKSTPYSQLGVQRVQKTIFGRWRLTPQQGGYVSGVKEAFYVKAIRGEQGQPTIFYGEIKNPNIKEIKAKNPTAFSDLRVVNTKNGAGGGTYWYALSENPTQKTFTFRGLDSHGKSLSQVVYHVNTDQSTTVTKAWDQNQALKKVIAKHPDFPKNPNQIETINVKMGGPQGATHNVEYRTEVSKKGTETYEVTFTKDWKISVNGKDVISTWRYFVTPNSVQTLQSQNEDPLIQTIK